MTGSLVSLRKPAPEVRTQRTNHQGKLYQHQNEVEACWRTLSYLVSSDTQLVLLHVPGEVFRGMVISSVCMPVPEESRQ